eukprot:scaffold128601_cov36-Tisochrysis_lutea.AAC.1
MAYKPLWFVLRAIDRLKERPLYANVHVRDDWAGECERAEEEASENLEAPPVVRVDLEVCGHEAADVRVCLRVSLLSSDDDEAPPAAPSGPAVAEHHGVGGGDDVKRASNASAPGPAPPARCVGSEYCVDMTEADITKLGYQDTVQNDLTHEDANIHIQ